LSLQGLPLGDPRHPGRKTLRPFLLLTTSVALLACAGIGDSDSAEGDPSDGLEEAAADVLFVVDSSGSMKEESGGLALHFEDLIAAAGSVDYQIAITTTSANYSWGETSGVDAGEAGTITGPVSVVKSGDPDVATEFRRNLLCDTAYLKDSDLTSDPSYTAADDGSCPLPEGESIPREYLNCLCPDGWVESEGAGNEEGLESALDTLCRASADAPAKCFDDDGNGNTDPGYPILPADAGSIADFIRPEADTLVVIISDEGDSSRRVPNSDGDPTPYLDIFSRFPQEVRIAVIGPSYQDKDGSCLGGAQTWGVERYQEAAKSTDGVYINLTDLADGCAPTDWSENLTRLGEFLGR